MAWFAAFMAFVYAISDKDPVVSVIAGSAGCICLALASIGEKVRK